MAKPDAIDRIPGLPHDEQARAAARRVVAANCVDVADASTLLAMLGLIDDEVHKRTPGTCPACGKELPLEAHSPKWGTAGYCSRKCRSAGPSKAAPPQVCLECGSPMAYKPAAGAGLRRTGAHGMCDLCYSRARGQGGAPRAEFVSPTRAADRIATMRDLGASWKTLEEATGLARSSLIGIMRGKTRKIRPETERAILAVAGIGTAVAS